MKGKMTTRAKRIERTVGYGWVLFFIVWTKSGLGVPCTSTNARRGPDVESICSKASVQWAMRNRDIQK
jgi:hypothetical protein